METPHGFTKVVVRKDNTTERQKVNQTFVRALLRRPPVPTAPPTPPPSPATAARCQSGNVRKKRRLNQTRNEITHTPH